MKATRTTFWLATMAGLLIAGNAYAATFAVDSLGTAGDIAPGDGVCDTGAGECTFAAALGEAMAVPSSADVVDMTGVSGRIPQSSPISITSPVSIIGGGTVALDGQLLSSAVFRVNSPDVTLSGISLENFTDLSVYGANANVDGVTVTGGTGLAITGTNPTVTNSRIYNTGTTASLLIVGGDNGLVSGNVIGLDPAGNAAPGGARFGILVQKSNGIEVSANSVSSSLAGIVGVQLDSAFVFKNRSGDFDGSVGNGAGYHGIWAVSVNNSTFDSNLTAGNGQHGLYFNGSSNNLVANHVAEGNGGSGVFFDSSAGHVQGSLLTNNAAGITAPGHGSTFAGNSIMDNAGLGIDLGAAGVTANSSADNFTNFPTLAGATGGAAVSIDGTHTGAPNTMFELEFFASDSCDASGNGEGARSVGTVSVTTDATGDAPFAASFSTAVAAGKFISATATGPNGTSEFSGCAEALPGADPEIDVDFYKLNSWTFNKRSMKPLIGVFFGSDDLDVDDITVGSLRLGTAPPCIIIYVDLNLDGHKDLVVGFLGRFTGASCGDSELELSGEAGAATFSETLGIRVVGCRGN